MEKSIKKIVVTLTAIFFCCVTLKAETVHIEVAGTLKDLLGDKQTTITELTLSGFVNGTDVGCNQFVTLLKTTISNSCYRFRNINTCYDRFTKNGLPNTL